MTWDDTAPREPNAVWTEYWERVGQDWAEAQFGPGVQVAVEAPGHMQYAEMHAEVWSLLKFSRQYVPEFPNDPDSSLDIALKSFWSGYYFAACGEVPDMPETS